MVRPAFALRIAVGPLVLVDLAAGFRIDGDDEPDEELVVEPGDFGFQFDEE